MLTTIEAQKTVQQYLTDRADRLMGRSTAAARPHLTDAPVSSSLRSRLTIEGAQLDQVREQMRGTPVGGYRAAQVEVRVDQVVQQQDANVAAVHATEDTKLYFGIVRDGAPEYEGYGIGHQFTLSRERGTWVITEAVAELEDGPPPPTQSRPADRSWRDALRQSSPVRASGLPPANVQAPANVVGLAKGRPAKNKLAPAEVGAMAPPYDYQAMYDYAVTFYGPNNSDYNPQYRDYGNDCTNFISQIMYAGGWEFVNGAIWERSDYSKWWYGALENLTSYSWAGANAWGYFAQIHSGRTVPLAYVDEMLVTDVLQVDWDHFNDGDGDGVDDLDHTMIVTARTGFGQYAEEIYVTYHSNNRLNIPFYSSLLPQVAAQNPIWYAHRT